MQWRHVVEELANAMQVAIGCAAQVRRSAQTTADEAMQLEASIARAVKALKSAQPLVSGKPRRR
jgi:hypothetical protein